jgi:deoxyribodipyrimidine photo-lyase
MKTLHWFRDDLRLHDNTALHHAVASASNMCLAVYFITPQTWREHDMAASKVDFILRGLECLAKELAQHNIVFIVQQCDKFTDIPVALSMLCQKHEVQAVFANEQYEINEKLRDKQVRTTLLQKGIAFHTYPDQCIIAPGEVKTQKGTAFTVFTPFKKAWLAQLEKNPVCLLPLPSKKLVPILEIEMPAIPTAISGFHSTIDPTLWPAGEEIAQKQLTHFIQHTISAYDKTRDIPSIEELVAYPLI